MECWCVLLKASKATFLLSASSRCHLRLVWTSLFQNKIKACQKDLVPKLVDLVLSYMDSIKRIQIAVFVEDCT